MSLVLDEGDRARLSGSEGRAMQLAMRLVLRAAAIMRADRLVPITFAHLDACFYAGQAHVDFARFLAANGARFAVTTWTNNGVVSLADPDLRPQAADPETVAGARELMRLYAGLGARQTWTCAPYLVAGGPRMGDHVAVGESNAVSYYNAVVGARTNKYGDYLDVACALTGKAPCAGLHTDEGRRAVLAFDTSSISEAWKSDGIFFHLLGHHVGRIAGRRVPVIGGLPPASTPDDLKAFAAAVAASGGVEMWHAVGLTPEAPSRDAVFAGGEIHAVTADDLRRAYRELASAADGPLDMVALGTPHFSVTEFAELRRLLDGRRIKPGLAFYVSTSRFVRGEIARRGWLAELEKAGLRVPVDICTYYSPAVRDCRGRVMTNAAKWAYYAPGMLGVEVCFGSLRECVESSVRGSVWRDPSLWTHTS